MSVLNYYKKPSLPSNLDEAAEEATKNKYPDESGLDDHDADAWYQSHRDHWRRAYKYGFKVGAEWLAEQGETQIVRANTDLDPHGTDYGIRSLYIKIEDNIPVGTKFIVQIRKK